MKPNLIGIVLIEPDMIDNPIYGHSPLIWTHLDAELIKNFEIYEIPIRLSNTESVSVIESVTEFRYRYSDTELIPTESTNSATLELRQLQSPQYSCSDFVSLLAATLLTR